MPDHAVLSAQTAEDCVVDQHWERYDAEDHAIWRTLFERQQATLKDAKRPPTASNGYSAIRCGPTTV